MRLFIYRHVKGIIMDPLRINPFQKLNNQELIKNINSNASQMVNPSKGSDSSIFTQGTQPTGPDQKVGGTETAQAVGKAAGTQFAANLSNDLFQNNLGKGLAPMNNIQQQYNGIYNGKVNMLRQIGIA